MIRDMPEWALPLLGYSPLKGAAGGRSSGKSHEFAEMLLDRHQQDPSLRSVCIREIQKSIKFSSYQLISDKIKKRNLTGRFDIQRDLIKDKLGGGVIVFQGMQDHTADSIKSLEGFKIAWFEEAQRASKRSLDLLLPTILRMKGAQCWFTWNPFKENDPIEVLSRQDNFVKTFCTYKDNPFLDDDQYQLIHQQAEQLRKNDLDTYNHIWLGQYNTRSKAQVFVDKYSVEDFEIVGTPLHGLDWGFSQDPTAGVEVYYQDNNLYIRREAVKVGLELDHTADFIENKIPNFGKYEIQADSARPESISHLKKWWPKIKGVKKWKGSVEDGIAFIRACDHIYIHPSCTNVIDEFNLYSYKIDIKTDEPTTDIVDKYNHCIDAIRYAIVKLIQHKKAPSIRSL